MRNRAHFKRPSRNQFSKRIIWQLLIKADRFSVRAFLIQTLSEFVDSSYHADIVQLANGTLLINTLLYRHINCFHFKIWRHHEQYLAMIGWNALGYRTFPFVYYLPWIIWLRIIAHKRRNNFCAAKVAGVSWIAARLFFSLASNMISHFFYEVNRCDTYSLSDLRFTSIFQNLSKIKAYGR